LDAEWIIPETRDVHSLKEIWVTQSPKTIVARDIVRKVAYVWFEDEDASKRRVDSRRKKQYQPRVTIENCERLISLEQHNICYLDSETRCFRWMNEDLIAQYVELGQGDVPVFSVVATCAANSSQLALLKTLNCSFAFVELCISKETPVAHPMEELGEYALEWRGWTLTKSTPEDAFYAAVERRDYDSALNICHFHHLVDDKFIVALWHISDGDADAARSLIQNVRDPRVIVEECFRGIASSPAALKLLLRRAWEVLENPQYASQDLQKKKHQIELWSSLLKLYQEEGGLAELLEMKQFFSYDIFCLLQKMACLGLTDIIFRFLKMETIVELYCNSAQRLFSILEYIPEVIPPRVYSSLLHFVISRILQVEEEPHKLISQVRARAFQIEERGGDVENVFQWLEIWKDYKEFELEKDWHRLEEWKSAIQEQQSTFSTLSLSTYSDGMDMQQQLLFILFHDTRPRDAILQDLCEDSVEYFRQRLYGDTFRIFVCNRVEENAKEELQSILFSFLSYAVVKTGPVGIQFLATFLSFSAILDSYLFGGGDTRGDTFIFSENVLLERNRMYAQFALKVAYEATCHDPPPLDDLALVDSPVVLLEDPRHWECDWDIEIIDSLGVLYEALPTQVPSEMESQIRTLENHLIILDYLWKYGTKYSLQFLFNVTNDQSSHTNGEAWLLLKNDLKNIPRKEIEQPVLDETTLIQKMESCYESLMDICRRLGIADYSEEPLYWICESLLVVEAPLDVCFKFLMLLREEEQETLLSSHITRKLRHQSVAEARKWISSWLATTTTTTSYNQELSESKAAQIKHYQYLLNLCDVYDLLNETFGMVTCDVLSLVTDEERKRNLLFQAADSICAQTKTRSLDYVEQQMIRLGHLLELEPKELSQLALATGSFKQGKMEWTCKLVRLLIERKFQGCWELCNAIISSYLSTRVIPEGMTGNDLKLMAYFACCHCPDEELVVWSEHLEEYIDHEFPGRLAAISSSLDIRELYHNESWSSIFYESDEEDHPVMLESLGPYDGKCVLPRRMKVENAWNDKHPPDDVVREFISVVEEFMNKGLAGAATALSMLSRMSLNSNDASWNAIVEQLLSDSSNLLFVKGLIAFAICYRHLCCVVHSEEANPLESYHMEDWCRLRFEDVISNCRGKVGTATANDLWNEFVEEWDSYQIWKATFDARESPSKEQAKVAILKLCQSTSLEDAPQIVSRARKLGVSDQCCCTELLSHAMRRYCENPKENSALEQSILSFVDKYKDSLVGREEGGWQATFDSLFQSVPGDNFEALKLLLDVGVLLFSHAGQTSWIDWCDKRRKELKLLQSFFDKLDMSGLHIKRCNWKNLTNESTCRQEWLSLLEELSVAVFRKEEDSKWLENIVDLANQLRTTLDVTPSTGWIQVSWIGFKLQYICEHVESPWTKLEEELYEKVSLLQTCELQDLVPFIRVGLRHLKVKPGISVRLDLVMMAATCQTTCTSRKDDVSYPHHDDNLYWQQQLEDERCTLQTIARISEWLWLERSTELAEYLFRELDREDMNYALAKRVFIDILKNDNAQLVRSVDSIYRGIQCLDDDWLKRNGNTNKEDLLMEIFSVALEELLLLFKEEEHAKKSQEIPWQLERCKYLLTLLSKALQGPEDHQDPVLSSSTAWEESLFPSDEQVSEQDVSALYKKTLEKCLEIVRHWVFHTEPAGMHKHILELMDLVVDMEHLHGLDKEVEINSRQQWKWYKLMNEMTSRLSMEKIPHDNRMLQTISHHLDKSAIVEEERQVDISHAIVEQLFPLCLMADDFHILHAFITTLLDNFHQGPFGQVVLLWLEKLIAFCSKSDGDSSLIVSLVQHIGGNFEKMGWEESQIEELLSTLYEMKPLLASVLGIVSGFPSLCNRYLSQLERIASQESVDLAILPLMKTWVLEGGEDEISKRLIAIGRTWLFAALVPRLLEKNKNNEERLETILGDLVDAGLVEQAGLLSMEQHRIHPAFRSRHAALGWMKRYWMTRFKSLPKISNSPSSSSGGVENRKYLLLQRLKYLEKFCDQ